MAELSEEEAALDAQIAAAQRAEIEARAWERWQKSLPEKFRNALTEHPKIAERMGRLKAGEPGTAGLVILGDVGWGKCVTGDALIVDPVTGRRRRLETVVADETVEMVHSLDSFGNVTSAPIAARLQTGVKQTLRVQLRSGRTLTVTPEHPFLLPDGWRSAGDITVGETVATARLLPSPTNPVRVSDALVVAAALYAAGSRISGHTIHFSTRNLDLAAGIRCSTLAAGGRMSGPNQRNQYRVHLPGLAQELSELRDGRRERHVPEFVFSLPHDQLVQFFAVWWAQVGHVVADPAAVFVTMVSEPVLRDVQHLLLRFGVPSHVTRKNSVSAPTWRLDVMSSGWTAMRAFLPETTSLPQAQRPSVGRPALTPALRAELDLAGLPASRMTTRAGTIDHRSLLTDPRFAGFSHEHPWLTSSDLWWDEICSISEAGELPVYDLSVDGSHCFLASDICVHNTWLAASYANLAIKAGLVKANEVLFGTEAEMLAAAANAPYNEVVPALRRLTDPKYKMMIIDDVGRGTWLRQDVRPQVFSMVFDAIWRDNRIVVVTSNLRPEGLEEYIGAGAMDRLRSMCGYDALYIDENDMRRITTMANVGKTRPSK